MKEEDNKNLVTASKEETSTQSLSKVKQMEKILDELCRKNGLTYTKTKPLSCTIMFVKH